MKVSMHINKAPATTAANTRVNNIFAILMAILSLGLFSFVFFLAFFLVLNINHPSASFIVSIIVQMVAGI
ncbi:hypothetical protein BAZO_19613 [Schinkia azotoformans LMG 9581]|uniref:Uncharacterized protein n=1 Tax=Schinkia azotoformans LMG 9581 TaxID=1131731 RepID=K6DQG6_SCHAZ|nr:hypothetical protein BAZO_19613 [Schinkia azotoformans LMG 9581]